MTINDQESNGFRTTLVLQKVKTIKLELFNDNKLVETN